MTEAEPKLGEVREFRQHIAIPLVANGLDAPFVPGFEYKTVERVWDGDNWVSTDPLDAPAPSTQV